MFEIIKIVFLILGVLSFLLGIIGIVVPLLPTTPFLLLALYCFAKSSKRIEEKFRNSKIYTKYLDDFVKHKRIPLNKKIFVVSLATIMLSFPLIILNSIIVKVVIVLLLIYIYYYFFIKIKNT